MHFDGLLSLQGMPLKRLQIPDWPQRYEEDKWYEVQGKGYPILLRGAQVYNDDKIR